MKIFRIDGQPSRDDECEHGFRRFEKCAHCLAADNARLRWDNERLRRALDDIEFWIADYIPRIRRRLEDK